MSTLPLYSAIGPCIRVVPVVIIVILSTPAWLTWPFLSEARQRTVLQMVDALAQWTRGGTAVTEQQEASCGVVFAGCDELG
jgi:hypothetical protein